MTNFDTIKKIRATMDTSFIMNAYIQSRINNPNQENATSDSGIDGKAYELAVRAYIMGIKDAQKIISRGVKSQGKEDIRFTKQGKRYTCEIKTACGAIETAEKNQYIIYCPTVDVDFPAEIQGYIFTREEWKEFIEVYNGRGSFVRVDKKGHKHIQSFYVSEDIRPKASKAIARYIEEVLFDMPTIEEFFNEE